jgi:hypothetical protein
VVREIFSRYVNGASARTIAGELNAVGVASSGSTWKREVRRCRGWIAQSIRAILRNPLYSGRQRWNVSQFVRVPDTDNKYLRRTRAKSEWVVNQIEALRIVDDATFERAQSRTKVRAKSGDERLRSGGRAKHLLSGLLRCSICGEKYILHDWRTYACSSHSEGEDCSNTVRVHRTVIEAVVLDPPARWPPLSRAYRAHGG